MNLEQNPHALASIKFLTGPLTNSIFHITGPLTTIGRDRSNDIVIPDQKVSRFHARLINSNNSWKLEKLSQTSTITIDQQEREQPVLSDNCVVGLGDTTSFHFYLSPAVIEQGEEAEPQSTLPFPEHPPVVAPIEVAVESAHSDGRGESARHMQEEQSNPSPNPSPNPSSKNNERPTGTEVASLTAMGISSLEVADNITGIKKTYPLIQEVINIGRDSKNDLVINDPGVSSRHFQIYREEHEWILVHPHPDRQQTLNGLIYQGRAIQGNESFRKPLAHGDVFRIGNEYGTLITLTYKDSSDRQQQTAPRLQPIRLGTAEITIGRLQDNDVVLNHPQVSAHHARLLQEEGRYRLTDLNSTNHTYVNGLLATSQLLQSGDEIRIGPFRFIYTDTELTQFDESDGIRIDALDLKKVGNNGTVLLNDISLCIPTRSFVALVGGSGAGKTTLLDALSGLRPAQDGSIFYNGQDYYHNLAAFSTQLGYVPQDDIIHRDLTVERALYYAARLRLPRDFTAAQIEERIDEVLNDVEITHRRKLLISQLSGGQRKRVSIALELLAKPSVFFLDEPTSGLDPGLDRKMMILLRKLADKGHTVILVTHATNNINVCDYVCFLAPGGNLAYFGPPEDAKIYFDQPDFAEIYSSLEPGDTSRAIPLEARDKFKQSQMYQKYIGGYLSRRSVTGTQKPGEQQRPAKASQRGALLRQFLLLSQRYLELLRNDAGNLAVLLLQAPLIGLLILLFIKGVGPGAFDPATMLQCPTTATVIAAGGYPDVPTPDNPIVSNSCQQLENFLLNDPRGKAYASAHGGAVQALQDFIISGPGFAPTILFLMVFSAIMFGCVNAIREIVKEAPIYRRERSVNIAILPYMFSKIAVLGVLCLLQSLVLCVCIAIFDPFRHSIFLPPFLEVYITIALTSLAGLMLGLMISAIAPNNDRATSLVPLLLIPQVIFSGTIFPLTGWYLQYPAMLFPIRWAMAALGSTVGLHSDKINGDKLFDDSYTYRGTLFSTYSQTEATHFLLLMWLALVVMIIVFGIITGYFLKRKDVRA